MGEQYSHLLIAADPEYVPSSAQIVAFYERLRAHHALRLVKRPPWEPGIIVLWPSGRPPERREASWSKTGYVTIPARPERGELDRLDDIPAVVDSLKECTIHVSGEWARDDVPIELSVVGDEPFEGDFTCSVQCAIRLRPVCTSSYDGEDGLFLFDDAESPVESLGVFANPWTGERIEVPGAGSARFWVQFEFGKWLFPRLEHGFDLMKPALMADAECCLGVRFVQAGFGA